MNVSKQIEEIIMDNVILGVDSGQAYFRDADQAVEKITTLLQTICLEAVEKARIDELERLHMNRGQVEDIISRLSELEAQKTKKDTLKEKGGAL